MPDLWLNVGTAVQVPVSLMPLRDRTDFVTIEDAVVFNESGMAVAWNFVTTAGVMTTTAITPTTGDDHDWLEEGTNQGMYSIEIPASGGDANNDTEGFGWITGETSTTMPFRGPTIGFRSADLNNMMVDGPIGSTPATQDQVGTIGASAGGALNFEATEDNSGGTIDPGSTTFVGSETNNYTDTDREDGTYHIIADATNVIDVVYGFAVGGGRTGTELVFKGFANANNDDLTLSVWDHPGVEWETLGTLAGKPGTSNETITEALLSKHTGTGLEIGKVYIRFNGSSLSANADLNVDQILIEAVGIGQSVGYQLGAIWVDTNSGVDATEAFVNGVADNPCKTISNIVSLLSSIGLHRVEVAPGSSLTFGEDHTDELWEGRDWTLALNSQNITGIFILGATVTGAATATAGYEFEECDIGTVTLDNDGHFERCDLSGTFTVGQAGTLTFHDCFTLSTSAVTIDFAGVGATAVHLFDFNGEINFKNMATGDTVHITGAGTITTETCSAGTIDHDGFFEYTDSGNNVTEVQSDIKVAVDAIKVPTDKMVFTKANELDTNMKSINDAEVVGDGDQNPWDGV